MIDYRPKYIRIAEEIKEDIRNGTISPGQKVYSEAQIIGKYEVSTTTARKALDSLKNSGLIERIQGKGTFVKEQKVERSLRKVISFTENMELQNIKPSAKLLEKTILDGNTEYHEKLDLSPGEKVLKIRRVKYGDGIPLLIDTRVISIKYCPGIENEDLTLSLYKLYEKYNIKILKTNQFLEMIRLKSYEAKLLEMKKNDPAMYIEGILYMEDNIPLEYEEDIWNANRFKFYVGQ
jgi:GntR family transcriptional regulator